MPLTITPSDVDVNSISHEVCVQDLVFLLQHSCQYSMCRTPLSTASICHGQETPPSRTGFVFSAVEAYNNHYDLPIYPVDIWFEILNQLYLHNRHAGEVRGNVVPPTKRKESTLVNRARNGHELDPNVVDPRSIMGSLQQYVSSAQDMHCGLPSVTLQGAKADWEGILGRLDKVIESGREPADFFARLRPILSRFVLSLDKRDSKSL